MLLEELIHSVSNEVMKMKDRNDVKDLSPRNSYPAGFSQDGSINKSSMVGFDKYVKEIKEWLIKPSSKREIISIVGKSAIGASFVEFQCIRNILLFIILSFVKLIHIALFEFDA
ncbi:putative late blight resistance protein-like protein R1A-10 [Forsythia ovata]|uniref:Late blight resistance protein-like protein R1A-10 n=1 Tax=Forsythia ovata TaxID=205694 RepID=A0ABD1TRY8_9LAMI